MKASQIAVGVLLVMVVLSGCMGATQEPGAANETGTNASETDTDRRNRDDERER
ncbi:MAG: hypothetical protein SV760_00760 [Halobacteria archaeon]|nr:hypothetical protein [Halobacteria archaeon]